MNDNNQTPSTNDTGQITPILGSDWPAALADIDITVSQHVATIILKPESDQQKIEINWGDGHIERIDFRQPPARLDPTLPDGRYKFQHVYFRSPVTGQYPARVYVIVGIVDGGPQEKSFGGTALEIEPALKPAKAPLNGRGERPCEWPFSQKK